MQITQGTGRSAQVCFSERFIKEPDQYKVVEVAEETTVTYGDTEVLVPARSYIMLDKSENPDFLPDAKIRVVYFTLFFWCRSITDEMVEMDKRGEPIPGATDDMVQVLMQLFPFYRRDLHPYGIIAIMPCLYDELQIYMNTIQQHLVGPTCNEWSCQARSALNAIVRRIDEIIRTNSTLNGDPSPTKEAVNYIHSHLREPMTIDDICGFAGVDKHKLSRVFSDRFGMPLKTYIVECRMRLAKHDLALTELSIDSLARNVGYPDPQRFTEEFSKRFGISPTQYRYIAVKERKAVFAPK